MSSQRINRVVKLLEELTQVATDSMPPYDTAADGEKVRWLAERNQRLNNLVQLYCATDIASSIGSIGPV